MRVALKKHLFSLDKVLRSFKSVDMNYYSYIRITTELSGRIKRIKNYLNIEDSSPTKLDFSKILRDTNRFMDKE
jgi:hypothetical protein